MSNVLMNNALLQSTGSFIYSIEEKPVGKIVEVIHDSKCHYIKYIVLESNLFFGPENRFFAIPASSRFISITAGNRIILQLNKDDIPFAKGIAADKYPKSHLKLGQSIFELYNYDST